MDGSSHVSNNFICLVFMHVAIIAVPRRVGLFIFRYLTGTWLLCVFFQSVILLPIQHSMTYLKKKRQFIAMIHIV